jgi:hypothetical protein
MGRWGMGCWCTRSRCLAVEQKDNEALTATGKSGRGHAGLRRFAVAGQSPSPSLRSQRAAPESREAARWQQRHRGSRLPPVLLLGL